MFELPNPSSVEGVSDWVELSISQGDQSLSKAQVASIVEQASGKEAGEAFISSIWRELGYRQHLYSREFFRIDEYLVESPRIADAPLDYMTCLMLSLYGVQDDTLKQGKMFERLVCTAIGRYLSGRGDVFGWPPEEGGDPAEGEEPKIMRKIQKLANDIGERFCESPAARFKDRGVDIAGWIPFVDNRTSQVAILIQCAAGHDWKGKLPVPIEAWCQYIHWASNPIKGFAVPCVIGNREWHDISIVKGILFDRIRILNLLPNGVVEGPLHEELGEWINQQIVEHNQ